MRKVVSSLIVALSISTIYAQDVQQKPQLVIGITIDQLKGDYLEQFYTLFGENGFKRLFQEGFVYPHTQFEFKHVDEATAVASIYTGTTPAYHGVVGNKWYDPKEGKEVQAVSDATYMGYATNESTSPQKLLTTTLTDELKRDTRNSADVFTFAPNKESAILAGGRLASSAFWIEDYSGKWASSTYYKELPWWFKKYVERNSSNAKIEDAAWTPSYNSENYSDKEADFHHTFNDGHFIQFKSSPLVNKEITNLVQECFKYGSIGKRNRTDFLSITYSARNYLGSSNILFPFEMMDTYLRLDQEIAKLLQIIEQNIDHREVLVFLTSTGYTSYEDPIDKKDPLVRGVFFPDRCASLLNMYLMAVFGQEKWVEKVTDHQIFFNRKAIEQRKLNLIEVQDKAAEFLMDFSGIQEVVPQHLLLYGNGNDHTTIIKNRYFHKYLGDLYFEIQPSWLLEFKDQEPVNSFDEAFFFPTIYWGGMVKKGKSLRQISTNEIAPTVCRIMRIRSPNGCSTPYSYDLELKQTQTTK